MFNDTVAKKTTTKKQTNKNKQTNKTTTNKQKQTNKTTNKTKTNKQIKQQQTNKNKQTKQQTKQKKIGYRKDTEVRKNGSVLFNDALNTFYLRFCGVIHMVNDHSDSEGGNPLPPLNHIDR